MSRIINTSIRIYFKFINNIINTKNVIHRIYKINFTNFDKKERTAFKIR